MSLFDGIEIFVQVVDSGSFTAAGEALGMAKSSVSEAVRRVEERLNVRLLDRTTRRLAPTEAGRTYYDHARRAMEQARIARSAARALALEPAGRLRVAVPETFERLIMPVLPAIFEALPGVEIEFVGGAAFVDLIEAGIDVAIRVAQQPAENMIVRKLGRSRVAILAAPSYLEKFGAPQTPHEIAAHRCIGFSPLFWGREWRFIGPEGLVNVPIRPILLCNSAYTLREAALNGLGLTTLPTWVVDEELVSGRLIEVLKDWGTPESGVYAVYPSNRMIAPKVRRFVEAVATRMREL